MIKSLAMSAGLSIALAGAAQASSITKDDVLEAQQEWADGIVEISTVYIKKGDYREAAGEHIDDLYAYGESEVLFKPTLAAEDQFRETFEEALSYFVGGKIAEDNGFAIKPWSAVRFGEQQIVVNGDTAVAMGNYYFTPAEGGEEVKVEYTFGYVMDENGELKINVHHSSLPFTPAS